MRRGCFGIRPSWARLRASREAGYRLADDRLPRIELTIPSGTAFYGWSSAPGDMPAAVKAYSYLGLPSRKGAEAAAAVLFFVFLLSPRWVPSALFVPGVIVAALCILLIVQYPIVCWVLPGRWYLFDDERELLQEISREEREQEGRRKMKSKSECGADDE